MIGTAEGTTPTTEDCPVRLFALLIGGAALAFVAEAARAIVFTDSWVDELVFVAGDHGFVTGKFVLYAGGFQTNYPPVGFLVIGLIQALAGPSFYVGRIVSAVVAGAGLALTAYTAARLGGRQAAILAVWLTVSTGFIVRYLVTATPYSLVLLFVTAAVVAQVSTLPTNWKDILSGAFMSLAMMTRQDMAILFILLILYLVWVDRSVRAALVAGLSGRAVAGLIAAPFLPEVLRVFVVTPGWNLLGNELLVQPPSWTKASRGQALLDYFRTYKGDHCSRVANCMRQGAVFRMDPRGVPASRSTRAPPVSSGASS
ncbi:MAG: glycosyltransferase family 39 protein [Candidatus Rokubacteria bacterium]|nr:glycosyltransferase family 39 protein [Candidatus Rokubacteria bacterium]